MYSGTIRQNLLYGLDRTPAYVVCHSVIWKVARDAVYNILYTHLTAYASQQLLGKPTQNIHDTRHYIQCNISNQADVTGQ